MENQSEMKFVDNTEVLYWDLCNAGFGDFTEIRKMFKDQGPIVFKDSILLDKVGFQFKKNSTKIINVFGEYFHVLVLIRKLTYSGNYIAHGKEIDEMLFEKTNVATHYFIDSHLNNDKEKFFSKIPQLLPEELKSQNNLLKEHSLEIFNKLNNKEWDFNQINFLKGISKYINNKNKKDTPFYYWKSMIQCKTIEDFMFASCGLINHYKQPFFKSFIFPEFNPYFTWEDNFKSTLEKILADFHKRLTDLFICESKLIDYSEEKFDYLRGEILKAIELRKIFVNETEKEILDMSCITFTEKAKATIQENSDKHLEILLEENEKMVILEIVRKDKELFLTCKNPLVVLTCDLVTLIKNKANSEFNLGSESWLSSEVTIQI